MSSKNIIENDKKKVYIVGASRNHHHALTLHTSHLRARGFHRATDSTFSRLQSSNKEKKTKEGMQRKRKECTSRRSSSKNMMRLIRENIICFYKLFFC
jgi:hypothetical protein